MWPRPFSGMPRRLANALRRTSTAAGVALFLAWLLVLRPQALGGPAGYVMVAGQSMLPTLEPGAVVLVLRQQTYELGDVVAYRIADDDIAAGDNVIHRIVAGDGRTGYAMRGDNTSDADPWHPTDSQVIGKVVFVVPGAAPALGFLRSPLLLGSLAAGIAAFVMLGWQPGPGARPRPGRSPIA